MAKKTEAYQANDGCMFGSLNAAVEHELTEYFRDNFTAEMDHVNIRSVAAMLVVPAHRVAIFNILKQLA